MYRVSVSRYILQKYHVSVSKIHFGMYREYLILYFWKSGQDKIHLRASIVLWLTNYLKSFGFCGAHNKVCFFCVVTCGRRNNSCLLPSVAILETCRWICLGRSCRRNNVYTVNMHLKQINIFRKVSWKVSCILYLRIWAKLLYQVSSIKIHYLEVSCISIFDTILLSILYLLSRYIFEVSCPALVQGLYMLKKKCSFR